MKGSKTTNNLVTRKIKNQKVINPPVLTTMKTTLMVMLYTSSSSYWLAKNNAINDYYETIGFNDTIVTKNEYLVETLHRYMH